MKLNISDQEQIEIDRALSLQTEISHQNEQRFVQQLYSMDCFSTLEFYQEHHSTMFTFQQYVMLLHTWPYLQ